MRRLAENETDPAHPEARALLRDAKRVARFQSAAGEWLGPDEWPTLRVTVVCRTAGCRREGVPEAVTVHENVDGVVRTVCGPCGRPHAERAVPDDT